MMARWLARLGDRRAEPAAGKVARAQSSPSTIALDGRELPIRLKRHPRAKRVSLRLAGDGEAVELTLPSWAPSDEGIAFAHARREWLEAQLRRIPPRNPPRPGAVFHYRGEAHEIIWRRDAPRRVVKREGCIELGGALESLAARLQRWLEAQALELSRRDLAEFCAKAGIEPVPLRLSRARKRWGSCSQRNTIRINWRLIQAPDAVRRSVVAHEVAHLVHFDHSPQFYALLERIYAGNLRAADRWLKDHGRTLYSSFG